MTSPERRRTSWRRVAAYAAGSLVALAALVLGPGLWPLPSVRLACDLAEDACLARALVARGERERAARTAWLVWTPVDELRRRRVCAENAGFVVQVLDGAGWPTAGRVGPEASEALWSIVQHHCDLSLQELALQHLTTVAEAGAVPREFARLLADRVAVRQGLVQPFGTQFERGRDGVWRRCRTDPSADVQRVAEHMNGAGETVDWNTEITCLRH